MKAQNARLVKCIQVISENLLKKNNEKEYFESARELLTVAGTLILQAANLPSNKEYLQMQALEYALDGLMEKIDAKKLEQWDH